MILRDKADTQPSSLYTENRSSGSHMVVSSWHTSVDDVIWEACLEEEEP